MKYVNEIIISLFLACENRFYIINLIHISALIA